ncbi:MAG: hypothetical protein IPG96_18360 [Proteobacteria bacterium]|nr:hypothetical protein [Pseudomonadota bacterium]
MTTPRRVRTGVAEPQRRAARGGTDHAATPVRREAAASEVAHDTDRAAERAAAASSRQRPSGGRRRRQSLLATRVEEQSAHVRAPRPRSSRRSRRQLTVLLACHGGVGATTLATSIGALVAQGGRRACIVDLDLQFGAVLTTLNLKGRFPLSEVAAELRAHGKSGGLDKELLRGRLPRWGDALWVAAQVGCVEGLAAVEADRMGALLEQIKRCFDVTLIDGLRDFNDLALAALDVADRVVLVATQDVPALRGLAARLDILRRLGYEASDLHVVLNRYSEKGPVPLEAIVESLGVRPGFLVANDFKTVHRAINDGVPLPESAPQARVTQGIAALVEALFAVPVSTERPGLWKRLLGSR